MSTKNSPFETYLHVGIALEPIHVGTGGTRIGHLDLTMARDPAFRLPKIPGSSLAGVYRAYCAMGKQQEKPYRQLNGKTKPYYPDCAGPGQRKKDGSGEHCGASDCPVCAVFGFARNTGGGFAGLAAFSDAHLLLFPVPTCQGPYWVTSPAALKLVNFEDSGLSNLEDKVYLVEKPPATGKLNLGWLYLPADGCSSKDKLKERLSEFKISEDIVKRVALLPDHLFIEVVNSNMEVRTSVAIDPETGAAEGGALYNYEALPRYSVLCWEVTCKNPAHFKINNKDINLSNGTQGTTGPAKGPADVQAVVATAHPYLEHLGIGGMGTRGMGRLKVIYPTPGKDNSDNKNNDQPDKEKGGTS